jgi:hypothetical protein
MGESAMRQAIGVVLGCVVALAAPGGLRAAPGSAPPTVSLTAPVGGSTFKESDAITLTATAAGMGAVSVEFRTATFTLGTVAAAPYTITVNLPAGPHALRAVATDGTGSTTSAIVNITVNPVLCIPPAGGVPAYPGPPKWFDSSAATAVYSRVDDPRWRNATAVTHGPTSTAGTGVSEHVLFRGLHHTDASATPPQSLYLSWWAKVAPDATDYTLNRIDVVIDPRDGGTAYLLRVNLISSGASGLSMTDRTVQLFEVSNSGVVGTDVTSTAAPWLARIGAWYGASGPASWAVNVNVPVSNLLTQGLNLQAPFGLSYQVQVSVAGSPVFYTWPDAVSPFPGGTSTWIDARLVNSATDPTCPGGVRLGVMDVGVTGMGGSSEIALTSANTFWARPWNFTGTEINPGAGVPPKKIMASFKIANWGTQPDWNSVADPTTLWHTVPLPPPVVAGSIAEQTGAIPHGAQAGPAELNVAWTLSPAQRRQFQTVAKLEWSGPVPRAFLSLPAQYFNSYDGTGPTGAAVAGSPSAPVNFTWNNTVPAAGVNTDLFAARWDGTLTVAVAGSYVFHATASDGVRLRVNGALVIDQWIDQPATEHLSAAIPLAVGSHPVQMDYYKHDRRRTHQCMLVELFGPNLRFQNSSVYRNMNFVSASRFEREADVSVAGLPAFPGLTGKRDVYLYVEARNMPSVQFRGPKEPSSRKDAAPPPVVVKPPPQPEPPDPEQKKRNEDVRRPGSPAAAELPMPPGPEDPGPILEQNASYVVHAYHDSGVRVTINGRSRPVLKPQTSFGYVVDHAGALAGWRHLLEGAQQIGPNLYKISVPDGRSVSVRTVIEAVEPRDWSFSVQGGVAIPHATLANTQDPGFSASFHAELRISNRLSGEARIGLAQLDGSGGAADLDLASYTLGARVYVADGALRPYLTAGVGGTAFNPGDIFFGATAGAGFQYNFSPECAVEAACDFHELFRNGANPRFSTLQVGVVLRF